MGHIRAVHIHVHNRKAVTGRDRGAGPAQTRRDKSRDKLRDKLSTAPGVAEGRSRSRPDIRRPLIIITESDRARASRLRVKGTYPRGTCTCTNPPRLHRVADDSRPHLRSPNPTARSRPQVTVSDRPVVPPSRVSARNGRDGTTGQDDGTNRTAPQRQREGDPAASDPRPPKGTLVQRRIDPSRVWWLRAVGPAG